MEQPTTGELVVVTGMTGAGRSTAAKELEDLGYYVVDNLPPVLLRDVVRLVDESRGVAAADRGRRRRPLRARSSSPCTPTSPRARPAATRRCSSSRRPTTSSYAARRPPAGRTRCRAPAGCSTGSQRERVVLGDLRSDADLVIDTSNLNVHQLTDRIAEAFGTPDATRLKVTVISFGFKYGIPVDADFVADMRFLPNPHWVPELRAAHRPRRRRSPTTSRASRARPSSSTATSRSSSGSPAATSARASGS